MAQIGISHQDAVQVSSGNLFVEIFFELLSYKPATIKEIGIIGIRISVVVFVYFFPRMTLVSAAQARVSYTKNLSGK
jgi:hypothetical protein